MAGSATVDNMISTFRATVKLNGYCSFFRSVDQLQCEFHPTAPEIL